MDVKKAALLAGALIIAITTALLARSMFANNGSSMPQVAASVMPAQPEGPFVLVATKALPVGTIVEAGSFRFQPWPKELVETAYFIKDDKLDVQKLTGSVVRNAITAGQPITQGSLIRSGERGFLAAALGPGMRAVTVPVSAQNSVAGFIFPGDRVDLMLTQSIAPNGSEGDPLKVSETILRNLRVLATDQRTNAVGEDGKPEVRTYSNVTLEVTPKFAEKIAVAQTVGSLSLSLRSIADNAADLDLAIANGNVALPNDNDPKAEKTAIARISAKPMGGGSFSTGADVSRYQRSTIPRKPIDQSQTTPAPMPGGGIARPVIGPVVRIARGPQVTEVQVRGK